MTCKHLNFSSSANYGASNKQGDNMDTWDPMDDDFACPTFNSYKNFDVLNAEHPSDKYVLKQKVHTPLILSNEFPAKCCAPAARNCAHKDVLRVRHRTAAESVGRLTGQDINLCAPIRAIPK